MYKNANKHIELFKQIPFDKFAVNVDFIHKLVNNPEKYGTYENILKAYYFIADEIWNKNTNKPLIEYNTSKSVFYFYDFVRKRQECITAKHYKPIKMLNGILDKNGKNNHFKKCHGLIIKNKPNVPKKDLHKIVDNFIKYSHMYEQDFYFYKKQKIEIPESWLEHLYIILYEICEKSIMFYKQPKSIALAQEMVNILNNQSIIIYSINLIKTGHDRKKIMRQLKEKKSLMFGEITHTYTR